MKLLTVACTCMEIKENSRDATRLLLDLSAIIAVFAEVSLDLLAIIAFCNQLSLNLTARIAPCIQISKDFACPNWSGPTLNFPTISVVCCQLSLDLIAIIALRF